MADHAEGRSSHSAPPSIYPCNAAARLFSPALRAFLAKQKRRSPPSFTMFRA